VLICLYKVTNYNMTNKCDLTIQELVSNSLTLADAWALGVLSAVLIALGVIGFIKLVERWA